MKDLARQARKMADECLGLQLRKASRVTAKIYDDALRPTGLQLTQMPILVALVLFGEHGATMNALANVLVMDRTTLTRGIRPLEEQGLLRVARSTEDARARIILLTRAGERALEEALPLWKKAHEQMRASLGTTRLDELHTGLDEVIALRTAE